MRKKSTPDKVLRYWTISRAEGVGAVAALAAIILWPIFAAYQEPFRLPYLIALGATAFCGLSILGITIGDLVFHQRRSRRLIPIRAFDVALGLLLTVPALVTLRTLLG